MIGHSVSSYSDYFIWHSTFIGIVRCEFGASARAVPESEKEIAIINYLHIPYDRSVPAVSLVVRKKLHNGDIILDCVLSCIGIDPLCSATNYNVGNQREKGSDVNRWAGATAYDSQSLVHINVPLVQPVACGTDSQMRWLNLDIFP